MGGESRGQQEGAVQVRERLTKMAEPYSIPKKGLHVLTGKAGHAVNRVPEALEADLLVMVPQRGAGARRLWWASRRMRARCDVLALKP